MNELILIVDDDSNLRKLICHHLERNNYRALEAATGREAIEILDDLCVDDGELPVLIIMDVMMPEQNGIDTCKIIKNNKLLSSIPIIMLTAKKELGDKLMGFISGANRYMVKPVDMDELMKLIAVQLRQTVINKNNIAKEINDWTSK